MKPHKDNPKFQEHPCNGIQVLEAVSQNAWKNYSHYIQTTFGLEINPIFMLNNKEHKLSNTELFNSYFLLAVFMQTQVRPYFEKMFPTEEFPLGVQQSESGGMFGYLPALLKKDNFVTVLLTTDYAIERMLHNQLAKFLYPDLFSVYGEYDFKNNHELRQQSQALIADLGLKSFNLDLTQIVVSFNDLLRDGFSKERQQDLQNTQEPNEFERNYNLDLSEMFFKYQKDDKPIHIHVINKPEIHVLMPILDKNALSARERQKEFRRTFEHNIIREKSYAKNQNMLRSNI